ncbi:DUF937 domain-containing protein [bacterium]|nr:DUF937 domain-containing protein [bacterium]
MSLLEQLTQTLGGDNAAALGSQLGLDSGTASKAISAALPMIIGAMARNASKPEGAEALAGALDRDHDGGILDNLGSFLGSSDNGAGSNILGHVFGQNRGGVESGLSEMVGINQNQAGGLMENLAPIVMGMLSKQKSQQGLDIGGLASMLGGESKNSNSPMGGMAMSMLSGLLDKDGDGNVMDDLGSMLGGFLGGKK